MTKYLIIHGIIIVISLLVITLRVTSFIAVNALFLPIPKFYEVLAVVSFCMTSFRCNVATTPPMFGPYGDLSLVQVSSKKS